MFKSNELHYALTGGGTARNTLPLPSFSSHSLLSLSAASLPQRIAEKWALIPSDVDVLAGALPEAEAPPWVQPQGTERAASDFPPLPFWIPSPTKLHESSRVGGKVPHSFPGQQLSERRKLGPGVLKKGHGPSHARAPLRPR